jgi:hypothetical protein
MPACSCPEQAGILMLLTIPAQPVVTDVSSTTKLVWSEESSLIRNFTVIVLPL